MFRKAIASAALLIVGIAGAQQPDEMAPAQVRITAAATHPVRRVVRLSGSVEAATESVVAAELAGVVTEIKVSEGMRVARGTPLVQLRATDLRLQRRVAVGQLDEARARFDIAERNRERNVELFEAGIISREQYDDAISEQTAWQARIDSLEATIARVDNGLDLSTIRAPFAGVVTAERTDLGEWVAPGDPVVELVALDRLEVRVPVPERHFAGLSKGTPAAVTFAAMPGVRLTGSVSALIPRADDQSRSFPVKVRIDTEGHAVAAGMLADVSMPLGERYEALIVPKDAVVTRNGSTVVYRVNGDSLVESVPVLRGQGIGAWVVVDGDLHPGDAVVTRGNERLFPGQAVTGAPQEYPLP